VKLEPDAGRAWPSVGSRSIAFDLSLSTAFTRSHDYWETVRAWFNQEHSTGMRGKEASNRTFEPFVAIVFVHENIV
jgi:hypothetical protein